MCIVIGQRASGSFGKLSSESTQIEGVPFRLIMSRGGCEAIVLTVDAPVGGKREKDLRSKGVPVYKDESLKNEHKDSVSGGEDDRFIVYTVLNQFQLNSLQWMVSASLESVH